MAMVKTITVPTDSRLAEVLDRLDVVRGPDDRGEHVCWCPFHPDGHGKPPHAPNLYVSERGYYCHACEAHGGLRQLAEKLGVTAGTGGSAPETTYDYCDEADVLLYQVCRYPGKRFRQRQPDENEGWIWNLKGVPRVLYRLPELLAKPEATAYVVEGEKDAERLAREGLVATTNSGGAGKWRREYANQLRGRNVVILPDNDELGRSHADQVASSLVGVALSVKVVELPGLPEKGDVTDWLSEGRGVGELQTITENAPVWAPPVTDPRGQLERGDSPRRADSQAGRLVALIESDGVELFRDDLDRCLGWIPVGGHREVRACRSKYFRQWLAGRFWEMETTVAGTDALSSALNVVEAKARYEGERYPLANRVAGRDGLIWYDLADEDWRAIRVTGDGWDIVANPPILFRRHSHERAQVEPVRGGDLRSLLPFVNLGESSEGLLLLVYIVCCFIPDISHPIPVLHGPQGAAKTTLFRMLRRLVDPSAIEVLSFPRGADELVQQLSHHWAPYYDNISSIPSHVSDVLCRAVTGEGFSKRELYTNDDDVIYAFRRCVGLNGVNVVANRPDLLDRCIVLNLEPIGPARRMSEEAIWRRFEEERPRLLGGILDALSSAIALRGSIHVTSLPRMADFALWGCAVAEALEYSQEKFLAAYDRNAEVRNEEALHTDLVAAVVRELMSDQTEWEGTATELLHVLEEVAGRQHLNTKGRGWPQAPHSLSRRLNEVRPNLAAVGICVEMRRDGRRRCVSITRNEAVASLH